MPPKSIFRQPGAKHFQLVHRSQRDPLIHDPDASKHVLKPVIRENDKKGKNRAELEELLADEDIAHDANARVGEASLYGIYYDDTEYDYMQHLRPVGVQEDGVESVLIEAPIKKPQYSKKPVADLKSKSGGILLRDLPQEALPSTSELPRTYESQQAIPSSISGFQPDMDPHLRQVLEALEDDAFVDDQIEDDFFGELVKEGERASDEEFDYEFHESGIPEDVDEVGDHDENEGEDESWEARFAQFKKAQKTAQAPSSDDEDLVSEGEDTVPGLPQFSVIGGKGKKRRKGSSEASGYSMSSSSMYRNEALQTLDERFDQLMLKEYDAEDDEEEPILSDEDEDEAPQLITTREDFTAMMDEFLNDYEILGKKIKPKLEGETGAEKLDTLRTAMGLDERVRDNAGESDEDIFVEVEETKDRWDCETILTTYSNLENHPRLIRARDSKPVPKIRLDPKTGLPSIAEDSTKPTKTKSSVSFNNDSDDSDYEDKYSHSVLHQTTSRPRNETAEEKKARKAAVKAQQAVRRSEKKANKEAFGNEMKVAKVRASRKAPTGMKKL
ncbi:Low temperature viability protein [Dendrothele bispora CBS 962.96]|uniref:Low temperature viability protein n=1 Tax=Dendrothele bispora (strain CBS 962.96) TaxID=1314807 RepID=A0A4S8MTM8_DENBC|nr:Low temperature viability protein [Dendrothele bispora CBS 962.96]